MHLVRDPTPGSTSGRDTAPAGPPGTRWWVEVGAALSVALFYLLGPRSTPGAEVMERAEANAWSVLELERALHLDIEGGVQHLVTDLGLVVPVNWVYGTLHFVVTLAALVHLYRAHPARYSRWRTAFVAASVTAFLCHRWWPVAPPRLLADTDGAPVLVDTLLEHSAPWTFHSGAISEVANQYAAMPSMHAGWALFCALAFGIGRPRRTRLALLAYPAAITVVIMASGNHFLLDAVGGFVVVGAALGAAHLDRISRSELLGRGQVPDLDALGGRPVHELPVELGADGLGPRQ